MLISLRRLVEWFCLFIIFFLITLFLYEIVIVLDVWTNPFKNYKDPTGSSIKVFEMEGSSLISKETDFIQRLRIFYWIGE